METASYSLGIDIGGTFTDIVVYERSSGITVSHKELTTSSTPHVGVMTGIKTLFERENYRYEDVSRVVHATTLFTNALIERKGAKTGLLTTQGFRDTLELSREHKYELFDLHIELPKPLVDRKHRLEVFERCLSDGTVESPLDEDDLLKKAAELIDAGIESVAIVFLHSYANAKHEQRALELLKKTFPKLFVSISSAVSPQIREYERSSTTVANAYVKPLADSYLALLESEISGFGIVAPLFMMLSNGGLTHIDEAKRAPIQLLESGPAAGALVGAFFGKELGFADILAFDMGGTTAKLALVEDGTPLISHKFEASREKRMTAGSGLPLSISTIELIEIGAGGGSIARLDELSLLKVGPQSAGSAPGPACYGRGGNLPTVTDANLVLGYLDPATFAGGTLTIDPGLARKAIQPLADQAGMSVPDMAWGIYSVVNENMAAAARVHIAERGYDARDFALLVTGGGGPLHGCEVAIRLGIRKVICPPAAGVASALGLLMAPARIDRMTTVSVQLGSVNWVDFESAFKQLEDEATAVITQTVGAGKANLSVQRTADIRFVGQGFEVVTALPNGPYSASTEDYIRTAFITSYRKIFGNVIPIGDVEVINIRVAASASLGETQLTIGENRVLAADGAVGARRVWSSVNKDFYDAPVYDRSNLRTGQCISGPAIIQEATSTLILPEHSNAAVKEDGSIIVDL